MVLINEQFFYQIWFYDIWFLDPVKIFALYKNSLKFAFPCPHPYKVHTHTHTQAFMPSRENSSVGRARPCQGRGRGFESRFSLKMNF